MAAKPSTHSGASGVARTYVNPRTVPRVLYIFDDVA